MLAHAAIVEKVEPFGNFDTLVTLRVGAARANGDPAIICFVLGPEEQLDAARVQAEVNRRLRSVSPNHESAKGQTFFVKIPEGQCIQALT